MYKKPVGRRENKLIVVSFLGSFRSKVAISCSHKIAMHRLPINLCQLCPFFTEDIYIARRVFFGMGYQLQNPCILHAKGHQNLSMNLIYRYKKNPHDRKWKSVRIYISLTKPSQRQMYDISFLY